LKDHGDPPTAKGPMPTITGVRFQLFAIEGDCSVKVALAWVEKSQNGTQ
jgi:hypothetical protein